MADISVIIDVLGTDDMVKATRAANRMTNEYKTLDRAFNKGKINAQQYAAGIAQVDARVDQLIASHQGSNVALNAHTQAVKGNTGALATNAMATQRATKSTKQFASIGLQQVGYQVSDFAVQVQSGTNALVAFGQQGSQLAGLLFLIPGFWGAVAGAVVSIAIPVFTALGNVFLNIGGSAEKAAEALQKNFDESLEKVEQSFRDATKTVSEFEAAIANINASNLQRQFEQLGEVTAGSFSASFAESALKFLGANLWTGFRTWSQITGQITGESFAEAFGRSSVDGIFNRGTLDAIGRYIQEQNVEALDQTLLALEGHLQNANAAGQAFFDNLVRIRDQVEQVSWATELVGENNTQAVAGAIDLADEIGRAATEALALSGYDLASPISDAAQEAAVVAANLSEALGYAVGINEALSRANQQESMVYSGRGGDPRTSNQQGFGSVDAPNIDEMIETFRRRQQGGRSGGGVGGKTVDPMERLLKQVSLNEQLLGLSEARQQVLKTLGDEASNYSQTQIDAVTQRIEAYNMEKQALEEAAEQQQSLADTLESSMSDAFMSMVEGTKSFKDAMKDMARAVIKQLFDILVVQKIVGSFNAEKGTGSGIVGAIMGLLPNANGNAFMNGKVTAFANGGVVNGPTVFPMANGMGLMGEAGPEAVMPLKRGKNGKLGVQVDGGAQQPVVINQSFNFSANGDESVKRIIAQEAPRIANLTQKQIMDQRRRGGAMKSTFG